MDILKFIQVKTYSKIVIARQWKTSNSHIEKGAQFTITFKATAIAEENTLRKVTNHYQFRS